MHHFPSTLHFAVGLQFWKNLAGKCILEFGKIVCILVLWLHIVFDLNPDIIVCLFILFKVHEMPYYGTFNTTSWIDIFRQIVYIVLIAVYWPLCLGYEGPNFTSISLYIILSCVECFGDSCAHPYIYGSNQSQSVLDYCDLCSVVAYLTKKYVFGYRSIIALIFTVFHQYCHLSFVLPACKQIEHRIKEAYLSLRSYIVLRHRFLKKYGKRKVCCYFLIFVLKICTILMFSIGIIKMNQQISVMYREYGWQQTIDFSNESLFDYRFTSMNNYSHPLLYTFEKCIQNTCSTVISNKAEESYLRKCDIKKTTSNEHVLLSVKDINWDRNSVYVWTFNDVPVSKISAYKYVQVRKPPDFYLIIRNVNSYDFGTYTLVKQMCVNLSNCENTPFYRPHKLLIQNEIIPVGAIACTHLIEQDSNLIIHASLGELIKLANITVIMEKGDTSTIYEFQSDSFWQRNENKCGVFTKSKFKTGYSMEINDITEQWCVIKLQMLFCVSPDLYWNQNYILYWINNIPMHYTLSFEPPLVDLFNKEFLDYYLQCEHMGYALKTFYKCIDTFYFQDKHLLNVTLKQYDIMKRKELAVYVCLFIVYYLLFVFCLSILDKLLFHIFHTQVRNVISNMNLLSTKPFEFDIYLSYNDEFPNDRSFAEETIKYNLIQSKGYKVCDCENIKLGQHRRIAFEENITKSKLLVILLSAEYLKNEICMQLEYEYTLLSLIGASKISRDNVLILKMDTCPRDARPLTQVHVLDWTDTVNNLRTESEKKEKLHEWLVQRFRKPGKLKMSLISWVLCPILRMIGLDLQPGNIERQ
ncbi:uncharacterized protein LOC132714858 [Ruditapes philippinarum]|uniref:uncharacterized protein LOC132714858 n=1 Tax=Ruditapes philippinarum TaxID=129788 RepID=UPI00295A87E6|nr:uncharacterized protein LOC132714858 [Ruditapes philippinarum]